MCSIQLENKWSVSKQFITIWLDQHINGSDASSIEGTYSVWLRAMNHVLFSFFFGGGGGQWRTMQDAVLKFNWLTETGWSWCRWTQWCVCIWKLLASTNLSPWFGTNTTRHKPWVTTLSSQQRRIICKLSVHAPSRFHYRSSEFLPTVMSKEKSRFL